MTTLKKPIAMESHCGPLHRKRPCDLGFRAVPRRELEGSSLEAVASEASGTTGRGSPRSVEVYGPQAM